LNRRSICATPAASLPAAHRRLPLRLSAVSRPRRGFDLERVANHIFGDSRPAPSEIVPLAPQLAIKRAAIPRAGYEYQDLAGIEALIRHYRDPDLYAWVMLEADDSAFRALDDVVVARKDGSYEFVQVKFTVDTERYEIDWEWLLAKSEHGTSMLAKWARSLARVASMGPIHSAGLKTNRIPSEGFRKCLRGTLIDLDLVSDDIRGLVEAECGSAAEARSFFAVFEFFGATAGLDNFEDSLRDQLVPTDTDPFGWLAFRHSVRRWAIFKNEPEPDGRILRQHVVQLITKRRPQPIRQDFAVPDGYGPPSQIFDQRFRERISTDANLITVLWGSPGRGKSTYLSFLTEELQKNGAAVTRHHYFLSAEDSGSNRTSFIEISTSLIEQLFARNPEATAGISEEADNLRAIIAEAAANLAEKERRLYVVVDGLDHVWRDTHRVDNLNHLFNELLPMPPNVSLIVGTQRVPDEQLPGRLLTIAKNDDWVEIPRMDEVAVHRWVLQQDKARPLILRFDPLPDRRVEMLDEIAKAFFGISQGHPLHLIYAYESLIHAGGATSADEVKELPACPDGDIRTYYQGLWVRLSAGAKNGLHMLAGADFFWPRLGIRQVLGDFSEIDFLLEARNSGMVPFHSSLYAWVRERSDHAECYQALLPKIIIWLANDAPEYWRWGWLWLARARNGDYADLMDGATRDWVVDSLAKGWPDRQIENILRAAEEKSFADGDYPRTLALRSLRTRVSNAREIQSRDFAAYRAIALSISHNPQQTLNLLDDIHGLDDDEVLKLACMGPEELSVQTFPACFGELARRVNAWILLRHRPGHEFTKLSDHLVAISAQMDVEVVRRTLAYVRGFRKPEPYVSRFIRLLGEAQNIDGLQFIRKTLRSKRWKAQRRMADDALVRVGSFKGADVPALVRPGIEEISLFTACWFLWRDRNANYTVHINQPPANLLREDYSLTENHDVEEFYYDSFWAALRAGLITGCGEEYSISRSSLKDANAGWLPSGLDKLEQTAREIATGRLAPTFSAIYAASKDIALVAWGASPQREYLQYRAFRDALMRIAVDLHLLGVTNPTNTKIPASEFAIARRSPHWVDEIWVIRNAEQRIRLLDKAGAAALLGDEARRLLENVTEFSDRGERWAQLADLARLYQNDRAEEFLAHAAECLVSYGHHKDLGVMEVLDSVVQLAKRDPAVTLARVNKLAPIIDVISEFTDGDEMDHVRSKFIEVVAEVASDRLFSLYEHHLSNDEYRYADECLIEFMKTVELESREGAALGRTLLDERTLGVLERRAANELTAQALLDRQNSFLGRTPQSRKEPITKQEQIPDQENEAVSIDPTSFGADDFAGLVKACDPLAYRNGDPVMSRWLHHWKTQGSGSEALRSILAYFETDEMTPLAERILDEAFLLSLALEGKDAAYSWLVRAHIRRHGWQSYWTSETEIVSRLEFAARHYADRWQQYIEDTSVPAPYYRRRGFGLVLGYKYLVRFLMLVGQTDLADAVTTTLVCTLVEDVRDQPIPEASWLH
jgi:AAA ATPase domain